MPAIPLCFLYFANHQIHVLNDNGKASVQASFMTDIAN